MRVVPVIDLMGGVVVRGVAGKRDEYRPIESRIAVDARPETVARALAARGYREAYLADLDAIAGGKPAWPVYESLQNVGLSLWVDAGVSDVRRARELANFAPSGRPLGAIVAGLETLDSAASLERFVATVGARRLIFSLDLKRGAALVRDGAFAGLGPLQIAVLAMRLGVRRMIVLDLAAVGMGQGVPTAPLCRSLRALDAELEITAGGGVRGADDLRTLAAAGASHALVASALHDGTLDRVRT